MLTTIKCYDYLHQKSPAIIDIFDIPEDIELLKLLEKIKYIIRQDYVISTPKNYIKFLNVTRELLTNELKDIDIRNLNFSHIKTEFDKNLNIEGYNLAYMNCIHFPDSNIEAIQRDMEILDNHYVLSKKIIL